MAILHSGMMQLLVAGSKKSILTTPHYGGSSPVPSWGSGGKRSNKSGLGQRERERKRERRAVTTRTWIRDTFIADAYTFTVRHCAGREDTTSTDGCYTQIQIGHGFLSCLSY